jgi:hypothetical protein
MSKKDNVIKFPEGGRDSKTPIYDKLVREKGDPKK